MAQPTRYQRRHDFTNDEQSAIDRSSINGELDSAGSSINQIRAVLAALITDDGKLAPGTVGVNALDDDAVDSLTQSVDKKSAAAETAASNAQDSADDASKSAATASSALEETLRLRTEIIETGKTQVELITRLAGNIETLIGVACQEEVWTVSEASEAGDVITLPNSLYYLVGRHHLRVSWEGQVLALGENFEEVGEKDHESMTIKMLMPLRVGEQMMAWTVPLGRGDETQLYARVQQNADAIADLSRNVVYKSDQTSSDSSSGG